MKNSILLFFLLSLSIVGFSQKISLGPEIGINIIPIENTNIGYSYQLAYHFGAHFKYHFSDKWKLSSGLFITQKKVGYSSSSTGSLLTLVDDLANSFGGISGAVDFSELNSVLNTPGLNLDTYENTKGISSEVFIEIPLLANYKLKNFNFYFGPYAGFLVKATRNEEVTTDIPLLDAIDLDALGVNGITSFFLPSSKTESNTISGKDGLRIVDFGISTGIGYEMNNVHFNLIYSHGILDYRDQNKSASTKTFKLARFSVVYLFDISKETDKNGPRFE